MYYVFLGFPGKWINTGKGVRQCDNATPRMRRRKFMEKIAQKVACENRKFYVKNPVENAVTFQENETMSGFIEERLYPMPPHVKNPLCWSARCDKVFMDYAKLFGYPFGQEKTEPAFWAVAKIWIPELTAIPWTFEMTLVKETPLREKVLYYWEEETYVLRQIGYNGSPPNPWIARSDESIETGR